MSFSVDINALIYRDRVGGAPKSHTTSMPSADELEALFSTLLDSNESAFGVTSHKLGADVQAYSIWLLVDQDNLRLKESKDGKSREFHLSRSKRYLSVNARKAQEKDFVAFTKKLKTLSLFMVKHTPAVMIEGKEGGLDEKWVALYRQMFSRDFSSFSLVENKETIQLKATILAKSAKYFSKKVPPAVISQEDEPLDIPEKVKLLKSQFLDVLEDYEKLYITNSKVKKRRQNAVYGLLINNKESVFVEKSAQLSQKFTVNFEENTIEYSGGRITKSLLDWFIQRVQKVGHDISRNEAEVFAD